MDTKPTFEELAERFERLEQENRRLRMTPIKVFALAAGISLLVGILLVIFVEEIGRPWVQVRWYFSKGGSRAILATSVPKAGYGAGLYITSARGEGRAILSVNEEGSGDASLNLFDEPAVGESKGGLHMLATRDGKSLIAFVDRLGAKRIALSVQPDGSPSLDMNDGSGRTRVSITVGSDGTPSIKLFEKDKKTLFHVP